MGLRGVTAGDLLDFMGPALLELDDFAPES